MDDPTRERYYRCYFICDDHIVGHEDVFDHDDDYAIEKARKLLEAASYTALELWRGKECIAKLEKESPSFVMGNGSAAPN